MFLSMFYTIFMSLNLLASDILTNIDAISKHSTTIDIDEFYKIKCDKLSFDKDKINEFSIITFSNKKIYSTILNCNLNKNINEFLAVRSISNCVNFNLFEVDKECGNIAIKIGEKLKNNGLNFTLLDEFYKSNFTTLQREYFIDLLQKTNNYEIIKFYLDNGVVVNENSRIISDIYTQILLFISHNCKITKEASESRQPTQQILEFVKTEKYQNFRNKQLKIANEILKYKKLEEFKFSPNFIFDDLFAITNDESYKIYQ